MTRRLVFVFTLSLLLSACAGFSLFPQHSEMREIHDLYRKEFSARFLPQAGNNVGKITVPKGTPAPRPFAKTLSRIRSFQLKYPDSKTENAHLTVLEGMIYMQGGEFSSAKLLSGDVSEAGKDLTGDRTYIARDKLFADNFKNLIGAWEAIKNSNDRVGAESKADALCAALVQTKNTDGKFCGETIDLASTRPKPEILKADAEGDSGPIYVAAIAAIAYMSADQIRVNECGALYQKPEDAEKGKACTLTYARRASCAAKNLIGLFLQPRERKHAKDLAAAGKNEEHLRYLSLFAQANKECVKAGGK